MATPADYERLGAWAVMLNPDLNIDRHKCTRKVPMQVLSLGMSRTGTLSMQEALTTLGYPTYHFSSIFANVKDADMWREALNAKFHPPNPSFDYKRHFDQLLGHVSAVTDTPSVLFWRELLEAYPDVKIVLVERNEDKWFSSFEGLVKGTLAPFQQKVLRYTDPFNFGRVLAVTAEYMKAFAGSSKPEGVMANARTSYRAHYASIRAAVPKEKILEYRLGSGWEPLCQFLGRPVPEGPFPKRNEGQTLGRAIGAVAKETRKNSLFNIAVVVGLVAVGVVASRRYVL